MSPNESLADTLALASDACTLQLEDHRGETLANDLLARIARAAAHGRDEAAACVLGACLYGMPPPGTPVALAIERHADGARARATAGRVICDASLRFDAPAKGTDYQHIGLPSDLPDPDSLPATVEYARAEGWPEEYALGPVEFRRVSPRWNAPGEPRVSLSWMKLRRELPRGDPGLELAALVFLSGFYAHWEFERRVGPGFDYAAFASRAHTAWVHEPLRWDDWLLIRGTSDIAHAGCAVSHRHVFARDGRLIATAMHTAAIGGIPD